MKVKVLINTVNSNRGMTYPSPIPTILSAKDHLFMRKDNLVHFMPLNGDIISQTSKDLMDRNRYNYIGNYIIFFFWVIILFSFCCDVLAAYFDFPPYLYCNYIIFFFWVIILFSFFLMYLQLILISHLFLYCNYIIFFFCDYIYLLIILYSSLTFSRFFVFFVFFLYLFFDNTLFLPQLFHVYYFLFFCDF